MKKKILNNLINILTKYFPGIMKYLLASANYKIVDWEINNNILNPTWTSNMGTRQKKSWEKIYKNSKNRQDLNTLRKIFREEINFHNLMEIGCANGYNQKFISEIKPDIKYIGVDKSIELITLRNTKLNMINADATNLPFKNRSIEVLLDGATLIHILEWEKALLNYFRVAKNLIILHSITIIEENHNILLEKYAYGQKIYEICFSRELLHKKIKENGFILSKKFPGEDYNLKSLIGLETCSETWLINHV
jgi:hypothetical protein